MSELDKINDELIDNLTEQCETYKSLAADLERNYFQVERERLSLIKTFKHIHKSTGINGERECAECGLDLMHPVHARVLDL